MYLTTNPTPTLRRITATCKNTPTACNAIEAEAGSALRSALAWGLANGWTCAASVTAWSVRLLQSLQPRKKAAKQSPSFPPWRKAKHPAAVGAIWSLSDVGKLISARLEHASNQ